MLLPTEAALIHPLTGMVLTSSRDAYLVQIHPGQVCNSAILNSARVNTRISELQTDPIFVLQTYGGPKRCRYSVEEINALTNSAAM